MKNKTSLFAGQEPEILISQETFNQVLALLFRDLYSRGGKGRTIRIKKDAATQKMVYAFVIPAVRIIIVDKRD